MNSQEKTHTTSLFNRELCKFYLHIEDYEHAIQIASHILSGDPTDSTALLVRGYIHEVRGNQPVALTYYDEILKHHPTDSSALKRKAIVEMNMHLDIKALSDINVAMNFDRSDSEVYFIRGMIYFYSYQKKIEAIVDYNKALQLNPSNAQALFHRGYAYLNYGNRDYARDDFIKATKFGSEDASEMLRIYFPQHKFNTAT
jgi:tetratricopeptide (TPR) repeat protein